jgi:uncharacterized SAM-binding protein YcdF (DUF218 family)
MDVATTRLIESLLLPPGGLLLVAFLGLIFWRTGFGRKLLGLSLATIWLLSLPAVADLLFLGLEKFPPISAEEINSETHQAIVVLGGGRNIGAPEYAGDTINPPSLARLRYAAFLSRKTGVPIIPSGGNPGAIGIAEARLAKKILMQEFGVEVLAIESRSNTTWENARYTAQLMKEKGISNIILVTDAYHMQRSIYAFQRNGINPTPAPTNFLSIVGDEVSPIIKYLPSGKTVRKTSMAAHEYLGRLWYMFK